MLIQVALFLLGLLILSISSDKLIDSSISLGRHLKLSNVFIALTVIAFGTSLPEFLVSFIALSKGSEGISVGNVIGSNIANVALIIGVIGLIFPLKFKHFFEAEGLKKKEILMTFFYVVLILLTWDGILSRADGLILLLFFVIFLVVSYKEGSIAVEEISEKQYGIFLSVFITFFSLVGLVLGANFMTNSAVNIATMLGIKDYVIGSTIVAIGTSLPELAASFTAVRKGELGMSLANIVGSNIFNILMVLGFISVIFTIPVEISIVKIDYFIMMLTAGILIVCVFRKNETIPKWAVYLSLVVYLGYIIRLIALAGI